MEQQLETKVKVQRETSGRCLMQKSEHFTAMVRVNR
ncbi:unnamed protein product [Tetraodon nigroviridis]|uniref:(spotted green pufferfish) hypothetical protein n=1 Tax=Tetraodon nigroviridis TaxID=99883 RepID=Q4SHW9_TETNG|nr:unnamed protein product [Tetraodon nigroviridis]